MEQNTIEIILEIPGQIPLNTIGPGWCPVAEGVLLVLTLDITWTYRVSIKTILTITNSMRISICFLPVLDCTGVGNVTGVGPRHAVRI